MSKFLTAIRSQFAVLSTLMVLISLGACYFFIYVPNNEKTVQERRFRCLQNIDANVQAKIDNSISLINNLLPDSLNKDSLDRLIRTLNHQRANHPYYSMNSFVLLKIVPTSKHKSKDTTAQFILSVDKVTKVGDTATVSSTIRMQYGFEQFIKPLLPAEVFDDYVVFINNKTNAKGSKIKEVYETFPSGLSIKVKDSLLEAKSGVTGPGLHGLTIGGDDYKVFSQPVSIDENKELIILGFVSNGNYQKERNQLPLGIVLLLLIIAIGMIISLPWIKLYHMGSKDKLTVTDGISSVLVSMLLMSLLFFVIFKYSIYFSSGYKRFSSSRNALAAHVTKSFERELDTAYKRLSTCDSIYTNLKTRNEKDMSSPRYDNLLKTYTRGIDIHQVFWLNKKGVVLNNWATEEKITDSTDVSTRDYFKNTLDNKPNKVDEPEFYLDQVVSRVSGVFISVIAKKSKNENIAAVTALGFTAKSLDSVIMPDGYQFAVIDNKGKVLYHSRAERNLNENLTKEFADSSNLVSCLQAKSDTSFNAEYYGRQYTIKIRPFEHLPYFTVIFEDLEYNNARDTEPYAFTISMFICLLVFMIIQIAVVFFVSSKRSFFKKQLFETSWIGPKTTSLNQYNQAIIGNGVVILLLAIFFKHSSFLEYMYILLFSVTFISIFLNGIFAICYKRQHRYIYRFKVTAVRWLTLFVAIIDYVAWLTLDHKNFWYLLLFETLSVLFCTIFYKADFYLQGVFRKLLLAISRKLKYNYFANWTYTNSFALMATTRLIITSGIPVAFLFIYSFNYEQSLDTRYRQLSFANALTQKFTADSVHKPATGYINKPDSGIIRKEGLFNSGVYSDGIFINKIEPVTIYQNQEPKAIKAKVLPYTREDSLTVGILSAFRLYKNNIALKNNNMNFPSVDSQAFFNKLTLKHIGHKDTTTTYYRTGIKNYIKLSSGRIDYPPMIFKFWVLLFLSLVVFYYVIHNIIKKLFALNLPSTDSWELSDEKLLLDNKLNALLFILGSPGSGKLNKLKGSLIRNKLAESQEKELLDLEEKGELELRNKKFNAYKADKLLGNNGELLIYNEEDTSKNNVFIADMINISTEEGNDSDWTACREDALKDKNALVIINHFEYNVKDAKTNSTKLNFLESLMQKGTSKIAIISTVHPLTFLDSFNEQQSSQGPNGQQNNGIPESELERWHVLLGHFRIIIESLTSSPPIPDDTELKRYIYQETEYSHFLNNMQQITLDTIPTIHDKDIGAISDSMIFKLQITSHYFYTYIWQSLTKEEKFLLYDLAEDGLVNPYDDYNLSMLICKGLIIKPHGTLMLFNKGFRNFILTAIGNTEANRIKDQVKDNGNWGNLKAPIALAILAILVFLIASQQEAYTRIITYITALGAGVPAVLKIFSLFPNSTQKAP